MRSLYYFIAFLPLLTSCGPKEESPSTSYKPILMKRTDLEKSISIVAPKPLRQPGKIYIYGNFLLIVEPYEGIHLVDNSNPSNPQALGFLKVPGCMDVATKNSILFTDNATDLVSIDISSIMNPIVTKRIPNVFPDLNPPDFNSLPSAFDKNNRPENTIIVKWIKQ